jgi:hypothetical protein
MKWGMDKRGSNPQAYMVKVLGRFDPYNPISYIFCYKYVMFCSSEIRFKLTKMIQNIIAYNVLRLCAGGALKHGVSTHH